MNAKAIAGYAEAQAEIIHKVLDENLFSVVIGGDCSIPIEITILDPDLDENGKYTIEFIQNFTNTFIST